MITIYALIDPRDRKVRYVGKTSRSIEQRIYEHKCRKSSYVTNWIKMLEKHGLIPEVAVLSVVPNDDWENEERNWIAVLRQSGYLTNLSDGGEGPGGFSHREESREKMSASHKGKVISDGTREKLSLANLGRKHSKQHRINHSASRKLGKGYVISDENRKKMIAGIKSDACRSKMSEAAKNRPVNWDAIMKMAEANRGSKYNEERGRKISLALIGWIVPDDVKDKIKRTLSSYWTPERRTEQAERARRQYRAKLAAMQEGVTTIPKGSRAKRPEALSVPLG